MARANVPNPYEGVKPASAMRQRFIQLLLLCGILSSLLYTAMLVFVPTQWARYSSASWTVSELSAIGAPTRSLWMSWALIWTLLYVAFGCGAWLAATGSRALRVTACVIVSAGIFGLFWPPMHQREVLAAGGRTLTDTLHVVWTVVNGLLTLVAMGFAAAALGKRFRLFTIATIALVVAAGVMTSRDAPGVDANLPTPWVGVWERVNIGAWLLWIVVLAVALVRRTQHRLESTDVHPRAGQVRSASIFFSVPCSVPRSSRR